MLSFNSSLETECIIEIKKATLLCIFITNKRKRENCDEIHLRNRVIKPTARIDDATLKQWVALSHKKIQSRREIKRARKERRHVYTYIFEQAMKEKEKICGFYLRALTVSHILKITGSWAFMCVRDAYARTNCCTVGRKSNFHSTMVLNMSTIRATFLSTVRALVVIAPWHRVLNKCQRRANSEES